MRCAYCGVTITPQNLTAGNFCSEEHAFLQHFKALSADYLIALDPLRPRNTEPAIPDLSELRAHVDSPTVPELTVPARSQGGPPEQAAPEAQDCPEVSDPSAQKQSTELKQPAGAGQARSFELPERLAEKLSRKADWETRWRFLPRLRRPGRWVTRALLALAPILVASIASIVYSKGKPESAKVPAGEIRSSISWLQDGLQRRAAVIFHDDFRDGLEDWQPSQSRTTWSFDNNGFVRPGSLAVYGPTMDLADYDIRFLGQIEQRALGVAFRVEGPKNYYAVKLMRSNKWPNQTVDVIRYAVVNGKEKARVVREIGTPARNMSLYDFELKVNGSNFTLMHQGRIVDYWSDGQFTKGGVGFFSAKGERSSIRWVDIRHQDDLIGRICALLTPK